MSKNSSLSRARSKERKIRRKKGKREVQLTQTFFRIMNFRAKKVLKNTF